MCVASKTSIQWLYVALKYSNGSEVCTCRPINYVGVPRLTCEDEDAFDHLQQRAGWEYQGYNVGQDFHLSDETTELGYWNVHIGAHVWTEPPPDARNRSR